MTEPTTFTFTPQHLPAVEPDEARYLLEVNRDLRRAELTERSPARYAAATVDEPNVRAWVDQVCRSATATPGGPYLRSGDSLMLLGPTGVGKSWQAWGAVRALAETGAHFRWAYVAAADLYAQLRPRAGVDAEQVFDNYARTDVLVIDDLGAAKQSEWTEEVNYRLINHRYEHRRPTLITTNLVAAQVLPTFGERVTSRLREMCQIVTMPGQDRRGRR